MDLCFAEEGVTMFTAGAWVLYAAAIALAAWGLLWDRSRGRRRCPSCWYDMSGVTGTLKCAECGKEVFSERSLRRTRRRAWAVVLALVVALLGWEFGRAPAIRERGWTAAVPGVVLAAGVPVYVRTRDDVLRLSASEPPAWRRALVEEVLARQASDGWDHSLSGRMWTSAADAWVGDEVRAPGDSEHLLVFHDLSPLLSHVESCVRGGVSREDVREFSERAGVDAREVIQQSVAVEDWLDHGGIDAASAVVGRRLVVRARPEVQGQIEAVLGELARPGEGVVTGDGVLRAYEIDENVEQLMDRVMAEVDPDGWANAGGATSFWWALAGRVLIKTTPENHERIAAFFDRR